MRARNFISIFVFLFLSFQAPAQDTLRPWSPDVLQEISAYRETDAAIIAKGRSLILDRVRAGDTSGGRPVLSYLRDHYRRTRYIPFSPPEEILLCFWASDFRAILNPAYLESTDTLDYRNAVPPPRDLLLEDLRDLLNPRRRELQAAIRSAPLRADESEFLLLFLEALLADRREPEAQNVLNEGSDDFLARFGDSPYAPFVRRDIRYVVRENRVGHGFTIGVGAGAMTGSLGNLFSANGALDLGYDLGIRQLIGTLDGVFFFRLSAALSGKVRSAFSYNGDWTEGSKQDVIAPEASLGLVAFESDLVQVLPFAGLSGIMVSPPPDAGGNGSGSLELDLLSWSAGLNADWKIGAGEGINRGSFFLIRTRLSFFSAFPRTDRRFNGNFVTFTIGFGIFGRTVQREF